MTWEHRMRATTVVSMAIVGFASALAVSQPASAFDEWFRRYDGGDPYAYRYVPKGYYPYYNSGYWKPASQFYRERPNFPLPEYYEAWGSNKRSYDHELWHEEHHGGHRRWDW
jgi:hypothetical protein